MKKTRFGELANGDLFHAFGLELRKLNDYNAETTGKRGKQNFLFFKQNLVEVGERNDAADSANHSAEQFLVEFKMSSIDNTSAVTLFLDGEEKGKKYMDRNFFEPFGVNFSCKHRGALVSASLAFDPTLEENRLKVFVNGNCYSSIEFKKELCSITAATVAILPIITNPALIAMADGRKHEQKEGNDDE